MKNHEGNCEQQKRSGADFSDCAQGDVLTLMAQGGPMADPLGMMPEIYAHWGMDETICGQGPGWVDAHEGFVHPEDILTSDDGDGSLGDEEGGDSVTAFGEGAYAFKPEPEPLARLGFRDARTPGAPFIGGGIQWLVDQGKKVPQSLALEAVACKGCKNKAGCEDFGFCQKNKLAEKALQREVSLAAHTVLITRRVTGHRGHRSL
jgi:hypothetical protein